MDAEYKYTYIGTRVHTTSHVCFICDCVMTNIDSHVCYMDNPEHNIYTTIYMCRKCIIINGNSMSIAIKNYDSVFKESVDFKEYIKMIAC